VADKVIQAALKLMLEPIFEAGFEPVSYGFRPMRRAHDAIAEIHFYGTHGYRRVLDADIEASFDNLSHSALLERMRARVKDKRVLALVKAFLQAVVLTELGDCEEIWTGTSQGRILSPLIFNVAMSALDERLHRPWKPGGTMAATISASAAAPEACRTAGPSATRTTSSCSSTAPRPTLGLCAKRSLTCSLAGAAAVTSQDPHRAHERGV